MCWLVSKEISARSMSFFMCVWGHIFEHSYWFVTEITPLLTPPHPSQVLHSCQINKSIPERTASHRERDHAAPYIRTPWIPHRYEDDYSISVFIIHQMPNSLRLRCIGGFTSHSLLHCKICVYHILKND